MSKPISLQKYASLNVFIPCAVATLLVGFGIEAPAQGTILEEIVVTAQKREQSIQDVGIAINAFTGEEIRRLGFQDSVDLASQAPGVYVSNSTGGTFSQFSIRGVTQDSFDDHIEGPNAVYIDGAYVASPQGQLFALFDVKRVEILKGPQGTLFGRNATGGLVHFITRKPTDEFEAYVDVAYGSYDQTRVEGAVSGPLSENVSARLSGMYNRHDPIMNNLFPFGQATNPLTGAPLAGSPAGADDVWDDDQWAARGQILWNINEDAELLLSGYGAEQHLTTVPYKSPASVAILNAAGATIESRYARPDDVCEAVSAETGACVPIFFLDGEVPPFIPGVSPLFPGNEDALRPAPGGDLWGWVDSDIGDLETAMDQAGEDGNVFETYGVTATLDWRFDTFSFTSISSYTTYDKLSNLDVGAAPVPQSTAGVQTETETFSQEVRFAGETDRMRWQVGAYFLYIDVLYEIFFGFSPDSPITTLFFGGVPLETDSIGDQETRSYSGFGQVDYDLTDTLTLIAGFRYIQEEKEYRYDNIFFPNPNDLKIDSDLTPFVTGFEYPSFVDDNRSDGLWTGKLQLEYKPNDDWLFYAGVNRGVKAGGYNNKLNDFGPAAAPEDIPFDEEVLLSYEGGFKSTLFDGTTNLNGALYYYDYSDYQSFFFSNISNVITNIDAEFIGVELDLHTRPADGLDIKLSGSYLDAQIDDFPVAPGVFRNVRPSFAPKWQVAGTVRYEWPTRLFGGSLAVQMNARYVSSLFMSIRNFDAHVFESRAIGNARVSWASPDEHWELSFFGRNIWNERYKNSGVDLATLCGCKHDSYAKPQWFGGQVRYTF